MSDNDEAEFYELLLNTCKACQPNSKPLDPAAMTMVFEDLQAYPLNLIKTALTAHRRDRDRGQWLPNTAHIEHQIEKMRTVTWLSADEAWAQVPKLEGQPGLLNQVSSQALAVASPLLDQGDEVAARMAFKAAYTRLVDKTKMDPDPMKRGPKYWLSPGGTQEEIQAVRDEGVRQGLLPAPKVEPVQQLAAPASRTPGAKPDLKALLLTIKPKIMPQAEREDYES